MYLQGFHVDEINNFTLNAKYDAIQLPIYSYLSKISKISYSKTKKLNVININNYQRNIMSELGIQKSIKKKTKTKKRNISCVCAATHAVIKPYYLYNTKIPQDSTTTPLRWCR